MSEAKWEPLEIVDRDVKEVRGAAVLTLTLSRAPDSGWIELFNNAGSSRRGSFDYVSGLPPHVNSVGTIVWTVPSGNLDDAFRHIQERVKHANANFPAVLEKGRKAEERLTADSEAQAARNADLQRRLDSL